MKIAGQYFSYNYSHEINGIFTLYLENDRNIINLYKFHSTSDTTVLKI